jgi:hypothetical protein
MINGGRVRWFGVEGLNPLNQAQDMPIPYPNCNVGAFKPSSIEPVVWCKRLTCV